MRSLAIVLAAGSGSRMKSDIPKQFMDLAGKEVLIYSLEAFEKSDIDDIYLVLADGDKGYVTDSILAKYSLGKLKKIVSGGSERYISVLNAIKAAKFDRDDYELVLIHDAARPLVSPGLINEIIKNTLLYRACIPAVGVKDTIKTIDADGIVAESLNRADLVSVQTPQGFSYDLCKAAYEEMEISVDDYRHITDDAMLIQELCAVRAKVLKGEESNFKLTTREDFILAEELLKTF